MNKLFLFLSIFVPVLAHAQSVYYCKDGAGRQIVTDQPCSVHGSSTVQVRQPNSYVPLSGGGGLTDAERNTAAQYKQRDALEDASIQVQRQQARQVVNQQAVQNDARCRQLENDRVSIKNQQRQNSTDWLSERLRLVNDEIYRLNCKTM